MVSLLSASSARIEIALRGPRGGALYRLAGMGIDFVREHLLLIVGLGILAAVGWFFAGWRLRGWQLLLWDLVLPLGAVAAFCIVGPGYLFPKDPWEGPHLITLSPTHALTLLDLPGLACAALALALAGGLLLARWRGRGRGRAPRPRRIA